MCSLPKDSVAQTAGGESRKQLHACVTGCPTVLLRGLKSIARSGESPGGTKLLLIIAVSARSRLSTTLDSLAMIPHCNSKGSGLHLLRILPTDGYVT
jgi:hypothetical protein